MLTISNTFSRRKRISHLPLTFAIIIHIPRPLHPCFWRSRVLYFVSSSPSSRVPKSQVPTHASRCPRSLVPVPVLYAAKTENALASEGKSCRPEKINMRVTTSQYEIYLISGQNSHLFSQNVFLQSIIYPTKKTIILTWGKGRVLSTDLLFFTQAR